MKIKKMVSAMTSGILAAIISVSAVPLTANAEPEKGKLTVSLLDFNISDEPVYPSTVRGDELYDFELTLKSGTKYKGTLSGSEVVFDNVTPDFEGAKITYKTDRSKSNLPDTLDFEFTTLTSDEKGDKYAAELTLYETTVEKEVTEATEQAYANAKNREELAAIVPEYTGNYTATLSATLVGCGLNSVFIADSQGSNNPDDLIGYWSERDKFALQGVTDVTVTAGGTTLASYYDYATSIVYFTKPAELKDKPTEIKIMGLYSDTEALYTADFTIEPVDTYVSYSADNTCVTLGIDAEPEFSPDDIVPDDDDADKPHDNIDNPIDDNPAEDVPTDPSDVVDTRSQINFNLTSKLDKYDTSLVANLNTWFNVCNASDKDKTLLADNPSSFGGFELNKNATASIKLGNGNYVPSYSELLTVTGAKPFSVKDTGSAEYKLVADAKYSLEIKGTGNLDYSINAVDYKTSSGYKFLIEPNVDYILIDNTSGNMYKATATDKNPKLVIDLTSKAGVIDNINNPTGTTGNPDYEDVPNTSDNILLFILLPLIAVVPLSIIGVLMFKKNRKAGMHND